MRAVYVCDAYMRACARRACRECAVGENQCVCVLTMLAMPYGDHNQWGGVLGVVWVPHVWLLLGTIFLWNVRARHAPSHHVGMLTDLDSDLEDGELEDEPNSKIAQAAEPRKRKWDPAEPHMKNRSGDGHSAPDASLDVSDETRAPRKLHAAARMDVSEYDPYMAALIQHGSGSRHSGPQEDWKQRQASYYHERRAGEHERRHVDDHALRPVDGYERRAHDTYRRSTYDEYDRRLYDERQQGYDYDYERRPYGDRRPYDHRRPYDERRPYDDRVSYDSHRRAYAYGDHVRTRHEDQYAQRPPDERHSNERRPYHEYERRHGGRLPAFDACEDDGHSSQTQAVSQRPSERHDVHELHGGDAEFDSRRHDEHQTLVRREHGDREGGLRGRSDDRQRSPGPQRELSSLGNGNTSNATYRIQHALAPAAQADERSSSIAGMGLDEPLRVEARHGMSGHDVMGTDRARPASPSQPYRRAAPSSAAAAGASASLTASLTASAPASMASAKLQAPPLASNRESAPSHPLRLLSSTNAS